MRGGVVPFEGDAGSRNRSSGGRTKSTGRCHKKAQKPAASADIYRRPKALGRWTRASWSFAPFRGQTDWKIPTEAAAPPASRPDQPVLILPQRRAPRGREILRSPPPQLVVQPIHRL